MNEAALRAYLLGKLTESEVELVENRLIEDQDLFSQLQVAEDDLFDAYARGELDSDESRRFLDRFGGDAGRHQFAKAFIKRTGTGRVLPFRIRTWMPLAMAASLLLVVGGIYLTPRSTNPAPTESIPSNAAPAASAPIIAKVPLALGTSRAAGGSTRVAIDAKSTQADLAIRLNPADRYAAYGVEIRSQAGLIIWGDVTARSVSENGDLILHTMVPADRLTPGTYEVSVRGGATAASLDDLGFITIEVSRTP